MVSYMPRDLFDMAVVTSVRLHTMTGDSLDQFCVEVCKSHRHLFPDDVDLEPEIKETSRELLEMMRSQFKDEHLSSAMKQLQFCIKNYTLDGKKKHSRFFGGAWFSRSKSRNPNRVKGCLRNIIVYHTGTINATFPLAPTGWSQGCSVLPA